MSSESEHNHVPLTVIDRGKNGSSGIESKYELHRRFDRMARLVGEPALRRLFRSHVMVMGLGGVGSFAAESLVRSGLGRVTLVDFDKVCVTNANRQLQAIQGNLGRSKAESLAERLRLVNPEATVEPIVKFYSELNIIRIAVPWSRLHCRCHRQHYGQVSPARHLSYSIDSRHYLAGRGGSHGPDSNCRRRSRTHQIRPNGASNSQDTTPKLRFSAIRALWHRGRLFDRACARARAGYLRRRPRFSLRVPWGQQ